MDHMPMTRRLSRALAVARKLEEERTQAEKLQATPVEVSHFDQITAHAWTGSLFAGPQIFAAWFKTVTS